MDLKQFLATQRNVLIEKPSKPTFPAVTYFFVKLIRYLNSGGNPSCKVFFSKDIEKWCFLKQKEYYRIKAKERFAQYMYVVWNSKKRTHMFLFINSKIDIELYKSMQIDMPHLTLTEIVKV